MSHKQFPCEQCGAKLEFNPEVATLKCPYCSHACPMPGADEAVEELDFHEALQQAARSTETLEEAVIKCGKCSAITTFDENMTAGACAFCGAPIVTKPTTAGVLRPKSLLPFAIDKNDARRHFTAWISSRWFAPGWLKQMAGREMGLKGVYVPYWTYDCRTESDYRGERGDDYQETERYTTMEDGKSVTKTRTVTKTRWTSVSGRVYEGFDDILILASESLPKSSADKLEPWDLDKLVSYDEGYLSGFQAEAYAVDLEAGFDKAKDIMDGTIRSAVRRDIGGDHQRVHRLETYYDDITFKHILLPMWIAAYRYKEKVYRFLVNARTGEVQGERPWSYIKIALLVLGILFGILAVVGVLAATGAIGS